MTRLKAFAAVLCVLLLAAWTHGNPLPVSVTQLIQDSSANYLVDASGNFLQINDRTDPGSTYNLLCQGDSLTANVGTVTVGYCQKVADLLLANRGITATFKPAAMSGYSWAYNYPDGPWTGATINSQAASQVYSELKTGLTNVLVMESGSNGMFLGGHSAATEFSDFQTGYNAAVAAGIADANIIIVTVPPRQNDAAFNTKRATYNASIISFCGVRGCKVGDAGGDATIGCAGCEDNTNCYQSDKIHWTGDPSKTCGGVVGGGQAYVATNLIYPQVP